MRSPALRLPDGRIGSWAVMTIVVMTLSACSAGSSKLTDGADDRAHRAGTVMVREKDGDAVDMVRRVVGGDPATGTAIEALVAEGDRFDGRIVLRITEREDVPSASGSLESVVRCYEYLLDNSIDDIDGRLIDCPDLPAMTIPEPAPPPTVPGGIEEDLRAALQRLAATEADEATVRQALEALATGVEVFEVTEVPGQGIGVVFGNGDDECVSGRITVDGTVAVWRVPRVVAQPGELGCSASSAARGFGKDPPH